MFPTLGVAPAMGRTFTEDEDTPAGAHVVVVSHAFWTNSLGADPGSIGRVLMLDGAPVTVIGVMPRPFDGPRALRRIDGWIPLASCLIGERAARSSSINVYGRLKAGITANVAAAQMDAALDATVPTEARGRVRLEPLIDEITGDVRQPLLALSGAAGFVLLIACANVASLLLSRADSRRRELSLRAALGCSRARVIRQLLTESVLFALCGGFAGLLMANWSLGALLSVMPGYIRRIDHIALDGWVLAMCLALSTATGFVFGLLPAVYASRVDPGAALKESALAAPPSRRWVRGTLIVTEVALSLALLTGAGLLLKTFLHLRPADPGFDPDGKVATTISLPGSRYADGPSRTAFVEQLQQRLAERPGVQAVAAASYLPLSGFISTADVQREDGDWSAPTEVFAPHVTPEYFSVMGMTILRGRGFTPADGVGSGVAIVNETLAQRMWPGQDPLGRRITFKGQGTASTKTIVGISRNVRDSGHRLSAASEVSVPFADEPVPILRVVVRTAERQDQISRTIREEVAAIDPILPIGDVESVAAITARSVATWRFAASLMSAFAVIALALAAVGLFAVVSCWVTERTPEIGVRMALGAGRGRVLRLFLARGAALTGLGLICGVSLAALTTRFLSSWLVDTSPLDWASFLAAAAAMAIVCMLATLLAARRAAGVDPLTALRS
jgi:putative ABC transport system permease protein